MSCRMRNTDNQNVVPRSSFDTVFAMHYDTFHIAEPALFGERIEYRIDR